MHEPRDRDERQTAPDAGPDEARFLRLPGLFRRFEFALVIQPGRPFQVEEAGSCRDGTPLFSLYREVARLRRRRHGSEQ